MIAHAVPDKRSPRAERSTTGSSVQRTTSTDPRTDPRHTAINTSSTPHARSVTSEPGHHRSRANLQSAYHYHPSVHPYKPAATTRTPAHLLTPSWQQQSHYATSSHYARASGGASAQSPAALTPVHEGWSDDPSQRQVGDSGVYAGDSVYARSPSPTYLGSAARSHRGGIAPLPEVFAHIMGSHHEIADGSGLTGELTARHLEARDGSYARDSPRGSVRGSVREDVRDRPVLDDARTSGQHDRERRSYVQGSTRDGDSRSLDAYSSPRDPALSPFSCGALPSVSRGHGAAGSRSDRTANGAGDGQEGQPAARSATGAFVAQKGPNAAQHGTCVDPVDTHASQRSQASPRSRAENGEPGNAAETPAAATHRHWRGGHGASSNGDEHTERLDTRHDVRSGHNAAAEAHGARAAGPQGTEARAIPSARGGPAAGTGTSGNTIGSTANSGSNTGEGSLLGSPTGRGRRGRRGAASARKRQGSRTSPAGECAPTEGALKPLSSDEAQQTLEWVASHAVSPTLTSAPRLPSEDARHSPGAARSGGAGARGADGTAHWQGESRVG